MVLVLTMAFSANAKDKNAPAMDIEAGAQAVMFNMGGIFSSAPSSFDGIGVGVRYAARDRVHVRAALGIDNKTETSDPKEGTKSENKTSAYGLEGGLDYILARNENLLLYIGGILQFGLSSTDPEGDAESDGTFVALAGTLGATWFFTQNVSLGAEYRLGFESDSEEDQDGNKSSTTRIGTGSAAFLLGFWF